MNTKTYHADDGSSVILTVENDVLAVSVRKSNGEKIGTIKTRGSISDGICAFVKQTPQGWSTS